MRHTAHYRRRRFSPELRNRIIIIPGVIAAVFVVANIILWAAYQNRTYPRTKVMNTTVGSVSYSGLSQKVSELKLLPATVTLTHDKQKSQVKLADLGISKDTARTVSGAKEQRSWLPVLNLFKSPQLQAPIKVDSKKLSTKTTDLAKTFRQDAQDARLTLNGATVAVAGHKDGYELDKSRLQAAITSTLDKGTTTVAVATKTTKPKVTAKQIEADKQLIQSQINTAITFKYQGKTKTASKEDVAKWYVASGNLLAVSPDTVRNYIAQTGTGFGIRVKDINQAVEATTQSLTKTKPVTITLTAQVAVKTYTYCVAAKGVSTSYLPAMRTKAASTFSDSRGWGLNSLVEFKEVSSGCNFTLWLAAPELMPTFGAICDSMWSCRVGPNVVINFDRWQNASPSWNANGGTLNEYRDMVINHETGHWLGYGHDHCPGAGQAAPVMQQQSINLQGCTFSPWPNAAELNVLRSRLGI